MTKSALLLVDIQNDFSPSGSLPVPYGDEIVPVVNELLHRFDHIVATLDWHPEHHGSFATEYEGKVPGEIIELAGIKQILWPKHCIQGSNGAQFISTLNQQAIHHIIRKGMDVDVDSYSGFYDNQKKHNTGLADYFRTQKITDVYIVGLAMDYCVKFTALDSIELGFSTYVIRDATRGVNLCEGDVEVAFALLKNAGCKIIDSHEIR